MKKNNKKRATALQYDPEKDGAPILTAAGEGLVGPLVAERILDSASEHDVPIVRDENLAALLSRTPVGREIPSDLYRAVAFVIHLDNDYAKR